jgi:formylglycine-generating enzyme required for sulfatase activity
MNPAGAWSRAVALALALAAVGPVASAASAPPPTAPAMRDCPDCPELVRVPAGEFTMGAEFAESKRLGLPDYWATREQPRHAVRVAKAFALGRYEVTRAEFARFARDTGYGPPDGCWQFIGSEWVLDPKRSWRDAGIGQSDDHPVTCINWHDARAYVDWLSRRTGQPYRLPSEAEWEYSARAGTQTAYWFGDDASRICAYVNLGDLDTRDRFGWDKTQIKYDVLEDWKGEPCRDGFPTSAPVTSTAANAFGVHGLLGNANEWTADCWNDTHAGAPATAEARLLGADCGQRVMKGQGWTAIAASVRPAFRLKMVATDRRFTFGFRVARDLPEAASATAR